MTLTEWKKDFKEYLDTLTLPRDDYKGIVSYIDEVPANDCEWIPVTERLPEKSGSYLTYLHEPLNFDDAECDWGYVTEMHFDMWQTLWNDNNVSYNAVLSAVYKDGEYFVSHWMPLPEPPKEET